MQSEIKNFIRAALLCSFGFVIISFLVFRTHLPKFPNIFLYNIVIIFSMQELGYKRSLFFLCSSIFLTILIAFTSHFSYVWNVFIFFITFLIIDNEIKKHDYHSNILKARIEEIKENINVLENEFGKHRKEAVLLEKKEARYCALKDIVYSFNSSVLLEDAVRNIMDSAFNIVGKSGAGFLFLVDIEKQELRLVSFRNIVNPESMEIKKGDILDRWVLKQRQCLLVEDIRKDFRFSENKFSMEHGRNFRSVVTVPLMENNKIIGILRLENARPCNYTAEDLRLLGIVCDMGAASLQNAMLHERVMDLSVKDGLTGLFLKKYFLDRLEGELFNSLRDNANCSLLIMDIDNFKSYNDEYGCVAGDMVLKTISAALLNFSGSGGAVCRYGGDEFALLLPGVSSARAFFIADNIRKTLKKEVIEFRRTKTHITISMGAAGFPEDAKAPDELIVKANERLYKAKRSGRDKIVVE